MTAKTKPAPEPQQPEPEPKPAEPYALVSAETYPRTFYRPVVQIAVPRPDGKGETVETITDCEHTAKYGHESERAALTCARRIAAQRGLATGAPGA
jgi:hypothetical protein